MKFLFIVSFIIILLPASRDISHNTMKFYNLDTPCGLFKKSNKLSITCMENDNKLLIILLSPVNGDTGTIIDLEKENKINYYIEYFMKKYDIHYDQPIKISDLIVS